MEVDKQWRFYNKLRNPLPIIFPWKGVWKVKTPRCVSFFVWTAVWDRILTGDNLRGRWDFCRLVYHVPQ